MKKTLTVLTLFFLCAMFVSATALYAQNSGSADADRQTILNDVTDFFATLGKSPSETREIVYNRRNARRKARLAKERERQNAQTQRRIKSEQQAIMEKVN